MTELMKIKQSITDVLQQLPLYVQLVAAAKTRTADEVQTAIDAGISILGYNYVQEAELIKNQVKGKVQWHLIGHLQRNKAKKAVEIFDMIETIDSFRLAEEVNKQCKKINKIMPVLIEINSGREENKTGVYPEDVYHLVVEISKLSYLKVNGLMTMGPYVSAEELRPYFRLTKTLFDEIKMKDIDNVDMKYLSMGMTYSYKDAIAEGANFIRIGRLLFGQRNK